MRWLAYPMARKTAAGGGAAKPAKAKRDAVASPPLNQEEFETAFKTYCTEKGECSSVHTLAALASRAAPPLHLPGIAPQLCMHQHSVKSTFGPTPGPPDNAAALHQGPFIQSMCVPPLHPGSHAHMQSLRACTGLACRLKRRLHGKEITVHALYNHVASYGGPEGASAARAWSRIADRLAGSASHKVPLRLRAQGPRHRVRTQGFGLMF